jgi:RNA polymerase sigma-70 factor, ECF subfamily
MTDGLLRDFIPNLPREAHGEVEEVLRCTVEEAGAVWPEVHIPPGEFVRYLAERLPEGDPLQGLKALNVTDLYLACACVRGDPRALRMLEAGHFSMIEAAVAQLRASAAQIDEVKQVVREEVLVGAAGKRPSLASYSGRGALGGWLRVTAVRCALRVIKKDGGSVPDPDLAQNLPGPRNDPELEHLKALYQREFHAGVEGAIRSLSDQERNLLRYHYVDGLTVDDLAVLYHAHRATVARWIAKARREIFQQTRRTLTAKLEVGSAEYESILRMIRSQMHITLSELLVGQGHELP